jgi:hypothetical protein
MCIFCAAIPAVAAAGAKINADQNRKKGASKLPVGKITSLVILVLLAGSVTYHTLTFRP